MFDDLSRLRHVCTSWHHTLRQCWGLCSVNNTIDSLQMHRNSFPPVCTSLFLSYERADRLASTALTSGLQLDRAEVLRGLRKFLNTDKPEHHSIDAPKERGVEKGIGRHSTLQGRERSVFNQANIGTVSRATLGRLLRDGSERVWAFSSATIPS